MYGNINLFEGNFANHSNEIIMVCAIPMERYCRLHITESAEFGTSGQCGVMLASNFYQNLFY